MDLGFWTAQFCRLPEGGIVACVARTRLDFLRNGVLPLTTWNSGSLVAAGDQSLINQLVNHYTAVRESLFGLFGKRATDS